VVGARKISSNFALLRRRNACKYNRLVSEGNAIESSGIGLALTAT